MWFHTISKPTAASITFNSFLFIVLLFLLAKVCIPFLSTKKSLLRCMNRVDCCMKYYYFLPVNSESKVFPIFLSSPAFEVGIPVSRAIFCFACVMPSARFHEKLRPGMGVDFFVMFYSWFVCMQMDSH